MSDRSNTLAVGRSAPACEVGGVAGFEGAELRHCDRQGKGGDVGDTGNTDQDGEAIGEARVSFDNLEDCGFDCRDLPIDLFEALSILTLQQRERQSFPRFLAAVRSFTRASRAT